MRRGNLRSIRFVLTLLILLAIAPMLTIVVISGFEQRQRSISEAERQVAILTHSMAEVLRGLHQSVRQVLSSLALTEAVREKELPACTALFKSIADQLPEYLGLTLVDVDGRVIASNRPFKSVSLRDRKHVRDVLRTGKFATGEFIVTRVGKSLPSFAFGAPVVNDRGEVIAVLTAVLRLDQISSMFDHQSLPEKSFISITDHQGVRIFYFPENPTNPPGKPIKGINWQRAVDGLALGQFQGVGSDGLTRILAFEKVYNDDSSLFFVSWAGIPRDEVLAAPNRTLLRNLAVAGCATIVTIIFTMFLARRRLVRPLSRLVTATRSFSAGDHHVRSDISPMIDELHTLTTSFNSMAEQLESTLSQLTRKEQHLEEAQRIAQMGSWEWDRQSDIFSGTRQLASILELPEITEGVPLTTLDETLTAQSRTSFREAIRQTLKTGQPYDLIIERRFSPERSCWLLVRCELQPGNAREQQGLRGTAIDITERHQMERERDSLQQQLLQSQKLEALGRLAGGIAHDFNNMLSIIIGNIELILDKLPSSSPYYDGLQDSMGAAERSAKLVRQLLAFARQQTVAPKVLDLNSVIGEMLTMMRQLIGEDIQLSWQFAQTPCMVRIDPGQLDQILANLCINAKDAISNGNGSIIVETAVVQLDEILDSQPMAVLPGKYGVISVSDNGCGMNKKTIANIFEPFFTTKELGKGTGLGLSTVFGIVRQNNGIITVDSSLETGTTFSIYLPFFDGETVQSHPVDKQETSP